MICRLVSVWIRLLLPIAAMVTIAAIILGRAFPQGEPRRQLLPPSYQVIDGSITARSDLKPLTLDLETGRPRPFTLPSGLRIDKVSLSPWEEAGRRQVVGIGWVRAGTRASTPQSILGLVRFNFPDGEFLGSLDLPGEAIPRGQPCWAPGIRAGVVYAGIDFRLYRVDFESPDRDGNDVQSTGHQPRPVGWNTRMPGAGDVQFNDVIWPGDPRLGGVLFASLRYKDAETGLHSDWQVWWLKLSRRGRSIIAAGRLLEPGPEDGALEPRLPNLVPVDGEMALAYLVNRSGCPGYELRIARLHVDRDSGSPSASDIDSRPLAGSCLAVRPVASPDGRRIIVVRNDGPGLRSEPIATSSPTRRCDRLESDGLRTKMIDCDR